MTPNYSAVLDFDYQLRPKRGPPLRSQGHCFSRPQVTRSLFFMRKLKQHRSQVVFLNCRGRAVALKMAPGRRSRKTPLGPPSYVDMYGSVIGPCLKKKFHCSDFFLDRIDFLFSIKSTLISIKSTLISIKLSSLLLWKLVGRNPSRRGASKRITRCDSLSSTYDHSRNIALFLIKLTIHQI